MLHPRDAQLPSTGWRRRAIALGAALLLAACGGGGDGDGGGPPLSCSLADEQGWLRGYMSDWYFWYRLRPDPNPSAYATVTDYFYALLYAGGSTSFPADRWSYAQSTESFNRFYGDAESLGYGVSVAGNEVAGRPDRPLYVRYVEPASPAAAAGVVRGDEVVSANGVPASSMIAADDYGALAAAAVGDRLELVLRRDGDERAVTLVASVFALTPVPGAAVMTSPLGRRIGVVQVKDMIEPALAPLETAFAQFKAAGVHELVIDLRYNGGGLVSVATQIGSYAAGGVAAGQDFATLLYNDRHAGSNQSFRLAGLVSSLALSRVYVLSGSRTCSASELVINGLRPFVEVVTIGDTTCGKPVGFHPEGYCGTTYSAVTFESVNADNEGRFFDGFDATCPVAEDFAQPLGSAREPLLVEAAHHADFGACSATATAARKQLQAQRALGLRPPPRRVEPGEHPAMLPR